MLHVTDSICHEKRILRLNRALTPSPFICAVVRLTIHEKKIIPTWSCTEKTKRVIGRDPSIFVLLVGFQIAIKTKYVTLGSCISRFFRARIPTESREKERDKTSGKRHKRRTVRYKAYCFDKPRGK